MISWATLLVDLSLTAPVVATSSVCKLLAFAWAGNFPHFKACPANPLLDSMTSRCSNVLSCRCFAIFGELELYHCFAVHQSIVTDTDVIWPFLYSRGECFRSLQDGTRSTTLTLTFSGPCLHFFSLNSSHWRLLALSLASFPWIPATGSHSSSFFFLEFQTLAHSSLSFSFFFRHWCLVTIALASFSLNSRHWHW